MDKPVVLIAQLNGDFAVMGAVRRALIEAGQCDQVLEYVKRAISGDYDNLLRVSLDYVDFK